MRDSIDRFETMLSTAVGWCRERASWELTVAARCRGDQRLLRSMETSIARATTWLRHGEALMDCIERLKGSR